MSTARDPIWPACEDCLARATCRPVPPAACASGTMELALIGEAPGKLENRDGKPFVGDSGLLLRAALKHHGYDSARTLLDNACRKPLSKSQTLARRCVANAVERIKWYKPKLVVALGAIALDALTFVVKGKARKGIMQWEGLMIEPATDTFPPIAAIRHPAAILRALGAEPYWTDLVGNLRGLVYKPSIPYYEIGSKPEFASVVADMDGMVTIDYETTGLEPRLHELRSVALTGMRNGKVWTVAARAEHIVAGAIRKLAVADPPRLVAQNANFEALWTRKLCGVWPGFARDTMIAAHLADENAPKDLSHLVRRHYPQWAGYDLAVLERVKTEARAKGKVFADISFEELLPYNAGDAHTTHELAKDLPKHPLERMLLDAALVFARLGYEGVRVDLDKVGPVSVALEAEYAKLVAQIRTHKAVRRWERDTGRVLNIRSSDQMAAVLFDRRYLGFRCVVKTPKTGKRSTAKKALIHINHPVVRLLDEARELTQRNSTFVQALPKLAETDGRVHPSFSVAATVTGQISCSRPNLTNVKKLPEIRGLYVPSELGGLVVSADYSQSQLGFLGMFANDERIIRAYRSGEDMHGFTARDAFEVEHPTKEQRDRGKTINYAILFGEGPKKLAEDLKVSQAKAESFIARWFETNKGAARFVKVQHGVVMESGVVDSVWKQLRRLPAVWSSKYGEVQEALRQAVNFPISNADRLLTLWAMIRVDAALRAEKIGRVMIEMHDNVVADLYRADDLRRCVEVFYRVMVIDSYEELAWMKFPMRIDVSWGEDWSCPNEFFVDDALKASAARRIMHYGGKR